MKIHTVNALLLKKMVCNWVSLFKNSYTGPENVPRERLPEIEI